MSNLKVVKLNNQVQQYSTGVYVEAAFEGDSAYEEELFELTDSSYEKYMNFRANPCKDKDVLVKLMAKDGRKIALFHNSPYKHHLPAHKACVLDQADVIICCYSVFLDSKYLRKCAVKSLFSSSTWCGMKDGKKTLAVFTQMKGLLPADMFGDSNSLEGADLLDEIRRINKVRYN